MLYMQVFSPNEIFGQCLTTSHKFKIRIITSEEFSDGSRLIETYSAAPINGILNYISR